MINKFKNRLTVSVFFKNIITLISGTSFAQGLTILLAPILTRLFSPEDFSTYGLYVSIFTVVSVIATGRYELAIVLPKKNRDAKNLVLISILISLFLSFLVLVIILLFGGSIAKLLNNLEIKRWLYLLPVSIFLVGTYRAFSYWFNRNKKYKNIAKSKLFRSALTNSSNIGFGFLKYGAGGLILGVILGQITETFYLAFKYLRNNRINIFIFSELKELKKTALNYKKFPLQSTWSALMNSASLQIPIFLLTQFFIGSVVGLYFHAHKILSMPITIIGGSIGQVFYQKASENLNDHLKFAKIVEEITKKLFLLSFIPLGIIAFFGDYIFAFIFGKEWLESGIFAMIISPWILIHFIAFPILFVFELLQKQKIFLLFNSILFTLRLSSMLIGYYLLNSTFWAIALYSLSGLISYGLMINYILRISNVKMLKILFFFLKYILIAWGILFSMRFLLIDV